MRYTANLTFEYKDARSAEAVEAALSVDAELSAAVERESRVEGTSVIVTFRCDDAKHGCCDASPTGSCNGTPHGKSFLHLILT